MSYYGYFMIWASALSSRKKKRDIFIEDCCSRSVELMICTITSHYVIIRGKIRERGKYETQH